MGNSVSGSDSYNNSNGDGRNLQIKIKSFEDGDMVEMDGGISVAEIMLQFPGHFVSDFSELAMAAAAGNLKLPSVSGTRVTAMPADAEMKPGGVYVLFEMQRLHAKVPTEQLQKVLSSTTALQRQPPAENGNHDVDEEVLSFDETECVQRSMTKTKNKKPARGNQRRSFAVGGLRGTLRRVAKVTPLLPDPLPTPLESGRCATNGCINVKLSDCSDRVSISRSFHTSCSGTLHRRYWTPKLETISEL